MMPLGEVSTLQRGFDLPNQNRLEGGIPIYAANGPVGFHNEMRVAGPGVITGRSGSIGNVHYVEGGYWPLNTSLYVKDFHGNDPKYIYWLLRNLRLDRFHHGTGVPTLNRNVVHRELVPIPPLPEQRRIAAILDKADALRVKRREAIAKLDQLLQSVFLEMFGDPVTNPKCRVVELVSLCERVTDGTHQSPQWSETGVPFLFQSNVKPGEINFETKRSISFEEYKVLTARCPIEYGDVLYTIVGSYGNAAMVKTHEKFCFQRHIAHLKPKVHVLPEFLEAMMNHPSVKRQADERVTGVAQKTLILKELKRLLVVEPSMEQQMQFRAVSQHISKNRKVMVESAVKLSDGFSAIQNAAFSGPL